MRYRTKDGNDYTVDDIGRTVNGIIVTNRVIEHPNFELIEEAPQSPAPTLQPSPPTPATQLAVVSPTPQTNQGSTN